METGVVKFHYETSGRELTRFVGFEELQQARQKLRRMGLLGVDESGIGFGNASLREGFANSFYITGSSTGGRDQLPLQDYAQVVAWDIERNWLGCHGQIAPSAESLTHAAIYASDAATRVVLHGHDPALWQSLLKSDAVTAAAATYGTPAMAAEVQRLFRETDVRAAKLFAMAGHTDGIIAFGGDFEEAFRALKTAIDPLTAPGRTESGEPWSQSRIG